MGKMFEVKYGTIYNKDGMGYDNIAVILSKDTGVVKYGILQEV